MGHGGGFGDEGGRIQSYRNEVIVRVIVEQPTAHPPSSTALEYRTALEEIASLDSRNQEARNIAKRVLNK